MLVLYDGRAAARRSSRLLARNDAARGGLYLRHQPSGIDMLIRSATADDFTRLVEVDRSATSRYYDAGFSMQDVPPRSEEDLREVLADTCLYVADDDQVVGYVSFYQTGPFMHLEELAVARAAQGRGVGTQLLNVYVDRARQASGCTHLSLVAFREARWALTLYERLGFRVAEESDWQSLPQPQRLVE